MVSSVESLNNHELTIRHSADGFSYVVIDNNNYTFVPAAVFQEKQKEQYLKFLGIAGENNVICSDYVGCADVYNVYAVSADDYEELTSEKTEFHHAASAFLTGLVNDNAERTEEPRIYLRVKDGSYEMTVLKGGNFLFDNSFRFKTKEDFLYFLLFTIEQLHLDKETVPVYFMGMIEEDSQIVELVKRYVRDIRFKKDIQCEL